jgi:hypothetical protein
LLLDASTISLGPNSRIRLDKFVYDPAAAAKIPCWFGFVPGGSNTAPARLLVLAGRCASSCPMRWRRCAAPSPGTQFLDSEIGVLASQTPAGAGTKLFASVDSISDGTHLLEGQLGGFKMRVFDGGALELARYPDGNLLDQDGNITTDDSQALAIPALSATIWTRGE